MNMNMMMVGCESLYTVLMLFSPGSCAAASAVAAHTLCLICHCVGYVKAISNDIIKRGTL